MTHSTIEQLTEHLLGVADEQDRLEVSRHLDSGCERCSRLLASLSQIRRVGLFDSAHRPPDGAVQAVKALGGLSHARRRPQPVKMRLSFDSLLSPGLAGTRSLQAASRHLVFCSQNFALDLRMDYERSVRDMVVVGQLLNRDWGPLPDVPTYLLSGEDVVSHSTTGGLGEFHMECRPRGPMHLRLIVSDDELIDVELDRRQPDELRPVLVDRSDLVEGAEVPDSIHSRSSDSGN